MIDLIGRVILPTNLYLKRVEIVAFINTILVLFNDNVSHYDSMYHKYEIKWLEFLQLLTVMRIFKINFNRNFVNWWASVENILRKMHWNIVWWQQCIDIAIAKLMCAFIEDMRSCWVLTNRCLASIISLCFVFVETIISSSRILNDNIYSILPFLLTLWSCSILIT